MKWPPSASVFVITASRGSTPDNMAGILAMAMKIGSGIIANVSTKCLSGCSIAAVGAGIRRRGARAKRDGGEGNSDGLLGPCNIDDEAGRNK